MLAYRFRGASRLLFAPILIAAIACDDDYGSGPEEPELPEATVISAAGDITAKVQEFRALLGEPSNGGTSGEQPSGRREIGWDGAGANPFNNRNDFPADFFNTNVKSGAIFVTNGTGFRNDSTLFSEINPSYADEFRFFSANRIFAPIGSVEMEVQFRVAGDTAKAVVSGFGIVFTDVDRAGSASVQAFDKDGRSLGTFAAPTLSNGLSFVGFLFDAPIVARVRIRSGDAPLGANVYDVSAGGTADVVVMDNFLYGEPQRIQ